jgi:hypothetical protein
MGLGFAAMRDAISFLRYEEADRAGNPNPLAYRGLADVAISVGSMSSRPNQRMNRSMSGGAAPFPMV